MMKRLLSGFLAFSLLLAVLSPFSAQAFSARPGGGDPAGSASLLTGTESSLPFPETGRQEDLSVLDCEIQIDEALDSVETRLILENTGSETVAVSYALPLISAGIKPGTLTLSASDEAERISETEVFFSLKPQGTIVFSYAYQTKDVLANAGAVGMDLTKLTFGENGRIGRFAVSVGMKEEDLPLIDEIFPVNYLVDGCEISVELCDFMPSALLNRFYLTKETYRNLKSGRDFEPNEDQQAVLENYRRWFRDGTGAGIPEAGDGGAARIFAEMIGAEITPGPAYLQRYSEHYSRLAEGNTHFQKIVNYLILREMIRLRAEPELLLSFFGNAADSLGLVCRDLLRQKAFGGELYTVAVALTPEPSLEGVQLYKAQRVPGSEERFELVPASEMSLLASEPYGFYHVKYDREYCLFRTSLIRDRNRYGAEELNAYLEAIGADLFVRQMIMDNRDGSLRLQTDAGRDLNAFFSCADGAPVTQEELTESAVQCQVDYLGVGFRDREDAVIRELSVPAFTQYIGWVCLKDGEARFIAFLSSCGHLSESFGLTYYKAVANREKGLALRRQLAEKRRAAAEAADGRIRPLETLSLREVPFFEAGDRSALYTLALDMEISEESDRVASRYLLENTGGAPVTACLPLPVLRNGAAPGSLKFTENRIITGEGQRHEDVPSGKAQLIAGNRLYLTLPAGGILDLSYQYLTASRLIHAGAVALDFGELVFTEGGRIGRFSAALTLREEDVPLVTEITPVNYTFDGRTVSVTLYDFAPNRFLSRFSVSKDSYRNLMGSRDYEPSDAELFVLAHYRKWFREGLPLPEKAAPDGSFYSLLEAVLDSDEENPGYVSSLQSGSSALYRVMLHLCLRTLKERGQLTKDWADSFLSYHWEASSLAPLTAERLRQTAFGGDPVLAAVDYAAEPSLAGVPLYTAEWKERWNGETYDMVREVFPVNERQLLRAVRQDIGIFDYRQTNLRVMTLADAAKLPAAELQDTLDVLGISLFIRSKLMDNREEAYGTVTYSPAELPGATYYRQAYFSLPQEGVLTREEMVKALLDQRAVSLWYGSDFFDVLVREDKQLSALTIPAFTQYAGVVTEEEEKAMVTVLSVCGNPLYSECGLKNYRAILSGRDAANAVRARDYRRDLQIQKVMEKIGSVTK